MASQKTHQKPQSPSFYVKLNSVNLPFVADSLHFDKLEEANITLQKFVRLIEKKFDTIWYIGTDIFGNEIFERFIFQHGGFMEISLHGEMNIYFAENKTDKMKKALSHAITKLCAKTTAQELIRRISAGQKLISLQDSILK